MTNDAKIQELKNKLNIKKQQLEKILDNMEDKYSAMNIRSIMRTLKDIEFDISIYEKAEAAVRRENKSFGPSAGKSY